MPRLTLVALELSVTCLSLVLGDEMIVWCSLCVCASEIFTVFRCFEKRSSVCNIMRSLHCGRRGRWSMVDGGRQKAAAVPDICLLFCFLVVEVQSIPPVFDRLGYDFHDSIRSPFSIQLTLCSLIYKLTLFEGES